MTFFELEKDCKKRKRRLVLFWLLIIGLIVLISVFIIKFNFFNKKNLSKKNTVVKIKKHIEKKKSNIKNKKDKQIVLKAIIDLNISDVNTKSKKVVKKEVKKELKKYFNKTNKIFNTSTLPSFETCIKLAKKFYNEGDYENSLKWAKNANIQNKKDPVSWIIVAKSLYKLNKKDEAIKVLQIYYDYTKNKDILKLIERMKNGKI
jgi:tetratricopeptide (TPR) repeat protein